MVIELDLFKVIKSEDVALKRKMGKKVKFHRRYQPYSCSSFDRITDLPYHLTWLRLGYYLSLEHLSQQLLASPLYKDVVCRHQTNSVFIHTIVEPF